MSTTHKLNPELETILPASQWKGNLMVGNTFQSYNPEKKQGDLGAVLKWQLQGNPQKAEKKADDWSLKVYSADLNKLFAEGGDRLIWMGHASFLLFLEGKKILIDPVYHSMPFVPRHTGLPVPLEKLTGIDYILISHDHRDHCDEKTLKQLVRQNPGVEFLTSLQLGKTILGNWLPGSGFQEAGWFQEYYVKNGPSITYLPASHWCKRGLFDYNNRLWGSFLVRFNGKTIYFGADSGYENHFREIGEIFPGIDVAMIGVGAYKPSFIMKNSHTSPQEAVQAFHDLGAKTLIPMHFGTFDLADEPMGEPWRLLREMEKSGQIEGQLALLEPGIIFDL